ncbi:MAG: hypothetical protein HY744_07000, partial [Deltaproteobacteria bacterium]|nr:hypothetical protein [Deltaproteobacteria bacterium]
MTDQPEHFEEGEEAPPRGVRAAVIVRWALLAAVILAALFAAYRYAAPWLGQGGSGVRAALYRCPMHPQIVSDHPGESCPICHMDLELVPSDQPAPGAASAAAPPPSGPAAPGLAPITLAPALAQAIGVRTAVAERAAAADV